MHVIGIKEIHCKTNPSVSPSCEVTCISPLVAFYRNNNKTQNLLGKLLEIKIKKIFLALGKAFLSTFFYILLYRNKSGKDKCLSKK